MDASLLDLSYLTESEKKLITKVLERDSNLQKVEDARIERLQVKAERTKNPIIKKKIRLRTGQWFFELQSQSHPNLSDRARGTDKVRESIRHAKNRNTANGATRYSPLPAATAIQENSRIPPTNVDNENELTPIQPSPVSSHKSADAIVDPIPTIAIQPARDDHDDAADEEVSKIIAEVTQEKEEERSAYQEREIVAPALVVVTAPESSDLKEVRTINTSPVKELPIVVEDGKAKEVVFETEEKGDEPYQLGRRSGRRRFNRSSSPSRRSNSSSSMYAAHSIDPDVETPAIVVSDVRESTVSAATDEAAGGEENKFDDRRFSRKRVIKKRSNRRKRQPLDPDLFTSSTAADEQQQQQQPLPDHHNKLSHTLSSDRESAWDTISEASD